MARAYPHDARHTRSCQPHTFAESRGLTDAEVPRDLTTALRARFDQPLVAGRSSVADTRHICG